ncbi:DUF1080 domain-containing protein [bacterium]|nr:DUF1080 domain-containing protein [bacterium]
MNMKTTPDLFRALGVLSALALVSMAEAQTSSVLKDLKGYWTLDVDSDEPAWMRVAEENGEPVVTMRLYVGGEGPYQDARIEEGKLKFTLKKRPKSKGSKVMTTQVVEVGAKNGQLKGSIDVSISDGSEGWTKHFTGRAVKDLPTKAPNLSKVTFGHPISLFNGKDLSGWRAHEMDKKFGWSVIDGLLVNTTPKTDFSATGAFANLRTEAEFEDFWLHIEFKIEADRNSGVYLRGMWEAQVVDRDSRMQGLQGVGAIFSRIAPSVQAGREPGEWQTYDLTLVDGHVAVVLNGVNVIDNQPVGDPTGGAIKTDLQGPGPIYLQGDHTSVKYRDIYLAPVIRK